MPQRLVFPAAKQVLIEDFAPATPAAGQVLVRTRVSLMSTGTETIVFNRAFAPGTHWDGWVKYPFFPGYTAIGVVEAVGPGVATPAVGTRVVLRAGHASHHVVAADEVVAVPEGIDDRVAVWFALAKIAFMGLRVSTIGLGDEVMVVGAGPIGQMAVRWAAAAGARRVSILDPMAGRLEWARQGGAASAISTGIAEAREQVLAAHGGALPRVVIEATGNAAVFSAALGLVRDFGRLVLLGDTGTPGEQRLTKDVITRGLTIVGAHDIHNDAQWNGGTITALWLDLVAGGRFRIDNRLNTHVFAPAACAEAYATATSKRGETMGILFDWTGA